MLNDGGGEDLSKKSPLSLGQNVPDTGVALIKVKAGMSLLYSDMEPTEPEGVVVRSRWD